MRQSIENELGRAAETGEPVSGETALAILRSDAADIPQILARASAMRARHFGNRIHLCSILNARSGACPEDCAFCAQSVHHKTEAAVYNLRDAEEIAAAYRQSCSLPIDHFGVVTSGEALDADGVRRVCEVVRSVSCSGIAWCASLGSLREDELRALKEAGLKRFHHNMETAESFFPKICSTHTYAKRLATIRRIRAAGLEICSGGILGMGESLEQRVELAAVLQKEKVDSIPLNFLIPIPGTRLDTRPAMKPMDILKTVAMFRMMNPEAEIKVCAGRCHLRDLQAMIFYAGATGIMIGPLLTVAGRDVRLDLQMLEDLEINVNVVVGKRSNSHFGRNDPFGVGVGIGIGVEFPGLLSIPIPIPTPTPINKHP